MLKHIRCLLIIVNFVIFVRAEGIYTIFSPGTLRSYFKYNVAITLHEAKGPSEIEVKISSSKFNTSKVINMMPMSTENVELQMPKLENDNYRLSVRGISGVTFENSTHLNLATYDPLVYIQLDKPVYKPGDLVQFRVIFLDEKTHPEHLKKAMTIYMKDGEYNTIQQWKNITPTHGVYTANFQLSQQSLRDWWHIEVHDGENALQQKSFGVIKYDLPTFEVFLDVPKEFAITEESIRVTVRTKYTFGKPVKGKATVSIEPYNIPEGNGVVEKTFPINGIGHVEFKIAQDFPRLKNFLQEKEHESIPFHVNAYVEEELTGIKKNAPPNFFNLHEHNIDIESLGDSKLSYHPGKLITYELISRKFDGTPTQYNTDTVELQIDDFVFYGTFNGSGIATFKFVLPEFVFSSIYCEYLGIRTWVGYLEPIEKVQLPPERFQLNIRTQNPQLREDLFIEIKWNEPMSYFVYILVGRGNVLKVERIEVPISSRSYRIGIIPTLDMIPEASIFVQYIYNDNLRFEEKSISFEEDFQNTIDISATAETSPGNDVEITISTDPYSYVGILGIDQSILLYGNDHEIKKHEIFTDIRRYDTKTPPIPGSGRYPGKISGLVSMTNAHFPWSTRQYYYAPPQAGNHRPVPRTEFPGTWIFENFNVTNQTHFSFIRKIPDTITTWVLTGFSMNSISGFALTKNPTKILSYKPFFITINLPYSVKQGEVISIPVLVFNYLRRTAYVEVMMDNTDGEFDFVKATNNNEVNTVQRPKSYKRISIPKNSAKSVSFMIRPKVVGMVTLKVTALTAMAGDTVHRILKVEPEGITQYRNLATLINLNDKQEQKEIFTVDLPVNNLVPHSEYLELSAVGDIMGLSVKYLENLVRLPVGYGEQNMINFVPSILVLKYLQAVDRKMPNVTKTALDILKIGFQREQNYRHKDGSYSAYGHADRDYSRYYADDELEIVGSTWLTAYVVRYFQQASEFIDIDEEIIQESLEFLVKKQTTNGNFAEFGHLTEFPHLNDESLTAFVLLAFLEKKGNFTKYEQNIRKGIGYLIRNLDDSDDLYALSITALVLQKFRHPLADEMLAKLKAAAQNENGFTWWTTPETKQRTKRMPHTFKSTDIEITAYILQAMLEKDSAEDTLPVVKWLTKQRNSNGGFTSTQDTIVGLQALVRFAEKTGISRAGLMDIEYVCEGNGVKDEGTITIKPDNLMVLNTYVLPKNTRKVRFTAKGNSSSLVQLSYSYNTIDGEPEQSFRLGVNVRENTPPKQLILDVCAKFVPTDGASEGNRTNMVVIEIALPSGYTIGSEHLEKIRDFRTVLFTETKKSDTLAIVYLQSLEIGHEKCISIEATKMYEVAKQKHVPVVIYDYSNKGLSATKYYGVKSSLCDICEGDNCIADCRKSETESSAFEL